MTRPGATSTEADGFQLLVDSLRRAELRPQVVLDDTPAPARLAPYAFALTAELFDGVPPGAGDDEDDEPLATGRLVLLHDPAGHDAWRGTTRLVTLVRATLEADIADDPLVGRVGWSWLLEALDQRAARHTAAGGTITRVHSESHGELSGREPTSEIEVRASWTPLDDDLAAHAEAWSELLCTAGGLPPLPPGVVSLAGAHRRARAR